MLKYPNIDPVILHIAGPIAIRWYSLAYIAGFVVSLLFFKHYNKKLKVIKDDELCSNFFSFAMTCLIVGARLFDCIFYNFKYTINNPLSILYIWEGGMSFHGGLIGLIFATYLFAKRYKIDALAIIDISVVVVPIALFFGRIANFINGELYGNITERSPFRMIFPTDPLQLPRHPSQLYEATLEGIILFIIMFFFFKRIKYSKYTGFLTGIFCFFYSIFRFICEFFRQPEISNILNITFGQVLSIAMFLASNICIFISIKRKKTIQ